MTKPTVNRLLISARGLALGEYTMTFNGADELGNVRDDDVKIKIKVVEPDPFEIKLTPGWNLVSLPAEPQMSGINDVVGADHPASIVLTYDPTQPGAWLSPRAVTTECSRARSIVSALARPTGSSPMASTRSRYRSPGRPVVE